MTTWINIAKSYIGTKEIPGPKSNPVIISWAKKLGGKVGIPYTDDDTAWCGLFMGHVFQEAGFVVPNICVRASEWAKFGSPCSVYAEGAVAVFKRPGGGHVGIIVGQTDKNLLILGGNQGNAVSITQIEKARCTDVRWPEAVVPAKLKPAPLAKAGKVSTNEA